MARFSGLPAHVHFIGICGRAMGAVAIELARRGVRVTGSDQHIFPPMDAILGAAGVKFHRNFDARHLTPRPDHVVIGSYFPPANSEVAATLEGRLPWSTLPGFLGKFLLPHTRNVVVTGTNGKTTTTSMLAWILKKAGKNPSWMVAGQSPDLGKMVHLASSPWFILEGDEYISGLGDLNPKFLHYQPEKVLVTNLQWDHVEVFPSERQYQRGFEALVDLLPPSGSLITSADDANALALSQRRALKAVETVGFSPEATHRITAFRSHRNGLQFKLGRQRFELAAHGRINAQNAAMAVTMAGQCGVAPDTASEALREWHPVAGRQEAWHDTAALTIIKEEAYHPHALQGAIEAVRARFPRRRLVLLLQPRYTGGRMGRHQAEFPEALTGIDLAVVTDPMEIVWLDKPFSSRRLVAELRRAGTESHHVPKVGELPQRLPKWLRPGDVLLTSLAYRNDAIFDALKALSPSA